MTRQDIIEGGKPTKFRDLPVAAQLAMVHYMAIDGEAWDYEPLEGKLPDPSGNALRDSLPIYVALYGDEVFGYHPGVPIVELQAMILLDENMAGEYDSWDAYHAWYQGHGNDDHDVTAPLWPVILSGFDGETLQDGWHRFHCYSDKGVQAVPVLFYIENEG